MVVICHANVPSTGQKLAIEQLASSHGIYILCLAETWLKPKHLESYILLHVPGFQKPFRLDWTSSRGGRVAVYLRNGITAECLPLSTSSTIECIGLRVSLPKRQKLFLFTADRPPNMPAESFRPILDQLELAMLPYLNHNVWLVRDFNAINQSWFADQTTDHHGDTLKRFTDSINLHQLIS